MADPGSKLRHETQRLGNQLLSFLLNTLLLPMLGWFRRVPPRPKSLLIIRLDALGDYILFRNFLEDIRLCPPYRDFHITLLGNPLWQDIALRWDTPYIDKFLWLDPKQYRRNAWYKFLRLYQLQSYHFEILLVPVHSRTKLMDHLASRTNAQHKIAPHGDRINLSKYPDHNASRYYTQLLPGREGVLFEFDRNREFIEAIIHRPLDRSGPALSACKPDTSSAPPYVVIVPGARHPGRQWSPACFAAIANYLEQEHGLAAVLVGSQGEQKIGEQIKQQCPTVMDRIGQTSTDDLVDTLAHSTLVISNETAAVHIAAALGKPTLCISNGSRLGRFHPYPPSFAHVQWIYPPAIQENRTNIARLARLYHEHSPLNIDSITVSCVKIQILSLLSGQHDGSRYH